MKDGSSKTRGVGWLACLSAIALLLQACQGTSSINEMSAKADAPSKLTIDQFRSIFGTKYLMASGYILVESERYFSSYEGKSAKAFNYVFMNPNDLTSQWLLPHSNYFFVDAQELPLWKDEGGQNKNCCQPQQSLKSEAPLRPPTQLLLYTLVKANTNDNKILDRNDRKTIAISDVSGGNYTELVQDVDSIVHQQMYSPDEFLVVYLSHGKHTAMRLHLKTRQFTLTKEIAPIPKSQQPLS